MNTEELIKPIKEKIRDTFASLIPEEQWEEMIKKEVDTFFHKENTTSYSSRPSNTDFQLEVQRLLKQQTEEKVKEYLQDNFNNIWYDNRGEVKCNSIVAEVITKNAGTILADMIGGAIQLRLHKAGFNTY